MQRFQGEELWGMVSYTWYLAHSLFAEFMGQSFFPTVADCPQGTLYSIPEDRPSLVNVFNKVSLYYSIRKRYELTVWLVFIIFSLLATLTICHSHNSHFSLSFLLLFMKRWSDKWTMLFKCTEANDFTYIFMLCQNHSKEVYIGICRF